MTDNPGQEPATPRAAIGVGMPALLHLNAWGREIFEAFESTPYLVGSAACGKTWRDVDVRVMLDDPEFDAMFPAYKGPGRTHDRWALMCAALSEHGRLRTGLPVDFQFQRLDDANAMYDGPRHALGVYLRWDA